jgi:signal transduction histidine kinase
VRIATRITLVVATSAALMFGSGGVLLVRQEGQELEHVARAEALLLGRSLQTAIDNALRDRQIEDIEETLVEVARVDHNVSVFVFDERGALVGRSLGGEPSPDTERVARSARSSAEPVLELVPEDAPSTLRLGLKLHDEASKRSAAVVLEKPLHELRADLESTRRAVLFAVLAYVAAVAALTWTVSRRHIGRPLGALVETMQRVRAGDLELADERDGTDEVGETRHEFRMLVRDLEATRARAQQEQEARRRLERGLEQADKLITLGQLSAVMAHEIGSPLQVLEGRARSIRRNAEDVDATRRTADMLVQQVERITRLVEQMLSISRRRPPARRPIEADGLVRGVVDLLEHEARRRGVSLRMRSTGSTKLLADPDQIQQLVLNLLRNALDASPRGSEVELCLEGADGQVELTVRDHGEGMDDALRAKAFEPFFTTKADQGGTGLGLSVVRSIVQEHRGTVELSSAPDRGCVVRVRLPLDDVGGEA